MKFRLEVNFEMDMTPHTHKLLTKLADILIGKRGGEVTFTRWSMKRIAENGRDVLSEVGMWESRP